MKLYCEGAERSSRFSKAPLGSEWLPPLLLFLLFFLLCLINPPCGHSELLVWERHHYKNQSSNTTHCATLHCPLHDWNQVDRDTTGKGATVKGSWLLHSPPAAVSLFPLLFAIRIRCDKVLTGEGAKGYDILAECSVFLHCICIISFFLATDGVASF